MKEQNTNTLRYLGPIEKSRMHHESHDIKVSEVLTDPVTLMKAWWLISLTARKRLGLPSMYLLGKKRVYFVNAFWWCGISRQPKRDKRRLQRRCRAARLEVDRIQS